MIFDTFWGNFAFQKSHSLKILKLSNPNMGRVDSKTTLKPYGLHMSLGGGLTSTQKCSESAWNLVRLGSAQNLIRKFGPIPASWGQKNSEWI